MGNLKMIAIGAVILFLIGAVSSSKSDLTSEGITTNVQPTVVESTQTYPITQEAESSTIVELPTLTPTPTILPTAIPNTYYQQAQVYSNSTQVGPTAQCRDGSYSYSQHRSGTCSHHGGVETWL